MNASPATVVSLGAWGDIEEGSGGGTSCTVREFALLSDGREVTLLDDRGWTMFAPLGEISLTHVVRNVYNVVLPDDAEETGEEHEWQRFEQRLREAGVRLLGTSSGRCGTASPSASPAEVPDGKRGEVGSP